jgi:GT2 family glycosyltransferase
VDAPRWSTPNWSLAGQRRELYAPAVFRFPRSLRLPSFLSPATPARRRDVFGAYRIAFGRDPESEAVVAERQTGSIVALLSSVFAADEFQSKVRDRLLAGGTLHGARFDAPPNGILRRWAASRLPLSLAGKRKLAVAKSWADLYLGLFDDPVFVRNIFNGELADRNLMMLRLLEARRRDFRDADIVGEVEVVAAHEVSGWALDRTQPDRIIELQLWIGDRLAATTRPSLLRVDINARFGGDGHAGFHFRWTGTTIGQPGERAEIRDAASKVMVATFAVEPDQDMHSGVVAQVRSELSQLRGMLDRIEAKLPALHRARSHGIDDWHAYFQTHYPTRLSDPTTPPIAGSIAVIIDGADASPQVLAKALASIAAQLLRPTEVVVVHRGRDGRLAVKAELDRWGGRLSVETRMELLCIDSHNDATWFRAALEKTTALNIVLLPAFARLAPDALATFSQTLRSGVEFVYPDEDRVVSLSGVNDEHHCAPLLLSAFDYDRLIQQGLPGEVTGVTRTHALRVSPEAATRRAIRDQLCLAAYEKGNAEAIVHIPQVLGHSAGPDIPDDGASETLRSAVRKHLARMHIDAEVAPHSDPCGGAVASALRIRFPTPRHASLAVVIPTRDRIDLLRPCIESIQASLPANRSRVEVIVVDNRSEKDETRAYLEQIGQRPRTRVLAHDDVFNWALINNRAAATVAADVLVFINNDTTVLTPDCWDELAAQSLRSDVGAVGARLLYGDGTIQHAGIVLDPWHSFASHEGVGLPVSDQGYLARNSVVREVSAVTGACLATRTQVFRDHGGFDDQFPVEGNDTDYCLRLRDRGLRILYDPFVTLYHFESKSRGQNDTAEKRATADRATALLQARWSERFQDDPFYNPHFDRLAPPFTRLQPRPAT